MAMEFRCHHAGHGLLPMGFCHRHGISAFAMGFCHGIPLSSCLSNGHGLSPVGFRQWAFAIAMGFVAIDFAVAMGFYYEMIQWAVACCCPISIKRRSTLE